MRALLLLSASLVVVSCAAAPAFDSRWASPRTPLMRGLAEPAPNLPHATPASPSVLVRASPQPNSAVLWQGDAPFRGEVAATGQATIGDNVIVFSQPSAAPIEIAYDAPDAMAPARRYAGPAIVTLADQTSPAGIDRFLVVRAGSVLLLGQVQMTRPAPQRIDLGAGIVVEQVAAPGGGATGYTLAPLVLLDRGRRVAELPIGQAMRYETSSGVIEAYVELSHHYAPNADSELQSPVYVVKAWFAGAS